jgi:hypothetical protein
VLLTSIEPIRRDIGVYLGYMSIFIVLKVLGHLVVTTKQLIVIDLIVLYKSFIYNKVPLL